MDVKHQLVSGNSLSHFKGIILYELHRNVPRNLYACFMEEKVEEENNKTISSLGSLVIAG